MSAAGEMQTAIFAALSADADLTALIGANAVHDRLLTRGRLPYVTFGALKSTDWSTASDIGEEHELTIEVWSDENGKRETQAIMAAVKAVLHDADLALETANLVNLRLTETTLIREEKSRRHRGTLRFRAVTESP